MLDGVMGRRWNRTMSRIPSARSIAVCGVVALALTVPGVSGASLGGGRDNGSTASPALGITEDIQYLTGASLSARLDQYAEIGVKVARFQLIWATVQAGGPAAYDWRSVDAVVAGLVVRGIEAIPVIDATPSWARGLDCTATETCAPADANQYATFAAAAAARYSRRGVHSWEIWNEPNNPLFWKPAPSPTAYAALLKAAYARIHAVEPTATVISGGLAPTETNSGWIAPLEFLRDMYAAGAQGSFDALGWHPYDYPAIVGHNWNQMSRTEPSARSLMVANGDGGKRIWATEFGAPTCTGDPTCVSEQQQSQMLSRAYALWRSYSWSGPLIIYSYEDRGTDESNREDHFGLVRHDGVAKPALTTFASIATGG
jgi:polysaccharide biosynthesis protein PslG